MSRKVNPEDRIIVNIPEYDGAGIYRIENLRTGKAYVGSATNVQHRIKIHDRTMRNGRCNSRFFEDVQNGDKFTASVIVKVEKPTRHILYALEKRYIEAEDLYHVGYNVDEPHFYTVGPRGPRKQPVEL